MIRCNCLPLWWTVTAMFGLHFAVRAAVCV